MSKPIIEVENLSKLYRVGEARTFSIKESYERWWDKTRGKNHLNHGRTRGTVFSDEQKGDEPNTFWALKDVSFSVNQGEVVGIIGRNGAGKSTLLKLLSKITEPTAGSAVMRGRIASLLEVGTGFHADLTGRENIYLNGAILGMRKHEIDKKFDEIVAFAEVEKFIDTAVKHYSSGMYVRLAFAVAAHLDPEILLVDEVLAVGDFSFQAKCTEKMKDVSGQGRTVLFVSHNLGVIQKLCPHSIMLDKGKKILDGPTAEIIQKYVAQSYVAQAEYEEPHDPEKPMHLRKINLLSAGGEVRSQFQFDEKIQLVIEYEVNKPSQYCGVWVGVFTIEGICVFGTADSDMDEDRFKLRGAGYYKTVLNVPEKWLNAGIYRLVVGVTRYAPFFNYDRVEAVGFIIQDIGTPEKLRTGHNRPGVLQPFLKWETFKNEKII